MTNSPPSKVNSLDTDSAEVLCSGIDSLVLTLDLHWKKEEIFNMLRQSKEQARFLGDKATAELNTIDNKEPIYFDVLPHGTKGYEWLIMNREYSLSIGNWSEPSSRPNVIIEIRSETLHRFGVIEAVERILSILVNAEAKIITIKVNRVDMYCDILLPEECWSEEIKKYLVTRANRRGWFDDGIIFSGLKIGKGSILARLYDKALEIKQQSGKIWQYDEWGFDKVPTGFRVIRIEFQLRREKIKQLGISTFHDLINFSPRLWAYCTKDWLKLQDNPRTHHTQRHTFNWWKIVQSAYEGAQDANPLVAIKATSRNREQLIRQFIGNLTSIEVMDCKGLIPSEKRIKELSFLIKLRFPEADKYGASPEDLEIKIRKKMAKYCPSSDVYSSVTRERKINSFALEDYHKEQLENERKEFNKKKLWEENKSSPFRTIQ